MVNNIKWINEFLRREIRDYEARLFIRDCQVRFSKYARPLKIGGGKGTALELRTKNFIEFE